MASALEQEWERHPIQDSISIEQYNREIDEALASIETGESITQEEMEKRAAKW